MKIKVGNLYKNACQFDDYIVKGQIVIVDEIFFSELHGFEVCYYYVLSDMQEKCMSSVEWANLHWEKCDTTTNTNG